MSRSPISCRFWSSAINKDAADPQNHCIFDSKTRWPEIPDVPEHDLSDEDMMFVSLLYNYILALEAEESVKERERVEEACQA